MMQNNVKTLSATLGSKGLEEKSFSSTVFHGSSSSYSDDKNELKHFKDLFFNNHHIILNMVNKISKNYI